MSKKPTYEEIADDFDLWGEYVDPGATMFRDEFDALSIDEKVELQKEIFGVKLECTEDDEDSM